jgi:hypothetical protein
MQPEDVLVITLDGLIHNVTARTAITIGVQTGAIVPTAVADPADPENITIVDMRQPGPVEQRPGTRFACGCGLTFDAENADLGNDPRWTQGGAVDCPGC